MNEQFDIKLHKHKNIKKGSVICLIGSRGSGKSVTVKALCDHFKDIPRFDVVSKTERNNRFFSDFIPEDSIHFDYDMNLLPSIFKRQDYLIDKYGKDDPRTHIALVLDDCLCDKRIWKSPEIGELLMNGRHRNITFIFTLQYLIGISPELRSNIDFVFIYGQESNNEKKKIFDNYAGMFNNLNEFRKVFNDITEDYRCMVINRSIKTNEIEKKIFWYKAPVNIKPFKAGHNMFWDKIKKKNNFLENPSKRGKIETRLIE